MLADRDLNACRPFWKIDLGSCYPPLCVSPFAYPQLRIDSTHAKREGKRNDQNPRLFPVSITIAMSLTVIWLLQITL